MCEEVCRGGGLLGGHVDGDSQKLAFDVHIALQYGDEHCCSLACRRVLMTKAFQDLTTKSDCPCTTGVHQLDLTCLGDITVWRMKAGLYCFGIMRQSDQKNST